MKKSFPVLLLILAVTVFSCKKNNTVTESTSALQNAVNADTTLSIFSAAVNRASETGLLQQPGPVTVIAPFNDAFRAAGIDAAAVNAMSVATVDSMVKYWFIAGTVQPSSSVDSSITTLLGLPVFGAGDGSNIYFNGAAAVLQSGITGNTVLYKATSLILPPSLSPAQYLQADPSLSLFNEAMQRTGLINTLTGGWYTILAPDNTAFANAGFPDITSIDNADINTLTNIIKYHIINAEYFSNNLSGSISVSTDEGGSINVANNGGTIVITGNNSGPAGITKANILLSGNVIMHKIDTVLLP